MADRRMFTQKIIDSDAFLDMPMSAQALYFHLNMRADDDGFLNNPKKIMRMIGASEDDLKLLIAKRFILAFESGVIVIKHWRMHNLIRKDRYHPTQYQEELQSLELKDNGSYTEIGNQLATSWQPVGNQLATSDDVLPHVTENVENPTDAEAWQPNGNQMATEDRLGKDSIGKNNNNMSISALESEFDQLWKLYPNKKGSKKKALEAYKRARKKGTTFDEVHKGINDYCLYIKIYKIKSQYVKHGSTFFNQQAWEADWLPENVEIVEDDGLDGIFESEDE